MKIRRLGTGMLTVSVLAALLTLIAAAPASAEVTIDVNPSTDLADADTVAVNAGGFEPGSQVAVGQCLSTILGTTDVSQCDIGQARFATPDENGEISTSIRVRRFVNGVDCVEVGCIVGAADISDIDISNPQLPDVLLTANQPISFDPDAPLYSPPTVEIDVANVTATTISGTVTCSAEASVSLDANVFQEKGTTSVGAYGYEFVEDCGPDGTGFALDVGSYGGRLTGGPAEWNVYAYIFDNISSSFDQESGTARLRGVGGAPQLYVAEGGLTVTIDDVDGQTVTGTIDCGGYTEASIDIEAIQRVGNTFARGYGYEYLPCDGVTPFQIDLSSYGAGLAGGPATIVANAYAYSFDPDTGYGEYDQGGVIETVSLTGPRVRPDYVIYEPSPQPDSALQLVDYERTADGARVAGTIDCEVGDVASLYIWAESPVKQNRGRTGNVNTNTNSAYGFADVDCAGENTAFSLELSGDAPRRADVFGYAEVYDAETFEYVAFASQYAQLR